MLVKLAPKRRITLPRAVVSSLREAEHKGGRIGLVFTSRHYTRLVRGYGLRQEFITPHCPQQNGMVGGIPGGVAEGAH